MFYLLPPLLPHAGLQVAQLLVGLVEQFQLGIAPASPHTQAPLARFPLETTNHRVLGHQCCLLQDSEGTGEEKQRCDVREGKEV